MTLPSEYPLSGLVLGIETATALGGVALVSAEGGLVGEITLRNNESHAERILPAVGALLETLGATLRDLAAVAVSCGPGSFTGLRSGIATAKGLAFSLQVPLLGIPTLEALAANAPPGDGPVCAVLGARRGEFFRAIFHQGSAAPQRRGADALVGAAELAAELPAGCLVVGELPDPGPGLHPLAGLRRTPPHLSHPRAAVIALYGLAALQACRDSELATLQPRYLRPSDAEAARCRTQNTHAGAELRLRSLTRCAPSASMKPVSTGRKGHDR